LIDRAVSNGPQIVTRRGEEVVVVLSREEYDRLSRGRSRLVDFFRQSPLAGVELDLAEEDRETNRIPVREFPQLLGRLGFRMIRI
jgi:antitoxin Phd